MKPAVFLDRDGTMIHDAGYLARFDDLRWYSWTIDAVRLLNRAGFVVCVTTNQGGIALGYYAESFMHQVHAVMTTRLEAGGARVDGWFFCPHHPDGVTAELRVDCECRKPKPGMIKQAVQRFGIDPARSFVIGDKIADIGMAGAAGAKGILVRTGHGEETLSAHGGTIPGAAHVAADLMEATAWLLVESGHPHPPA